MSAAYSRATACSCKAYFLCPLAEWDILFLLPVWCGHMIWSMWGSLCQERDSQRRRQEAGSSDSGMVDVTLTENREGHVGVSGEPDPPRNPSPPPSRSTAISLLMALFCSSHNPGLYIWVINTHAPNRYNLCNHVLHWLNLIIPLITLAVNSLEWVKMWSSMHYTEKKREHSEWRLKKNFSPFSMSMTRDGWFSCHGDIGYVEFRKSISTLAASH